MGNADSKEVVVDESTMEASPSLASKTTGLSGKSHSSPISTQKRDDDLGLKEDTSDTRITDDQVHVNLAMADLMAYLQVVANNSTNLPLTRRDDPDLDLADIQSTTEDYARKSAAFVPADVRMIGGMFTRYGRVWDLPTSEVGCLSGE